MAKDPKGDSAPEKPKAVGLDSKLTFKPYEPKPRSLWWCGTFPGGPQVISTSAHTFIGYKEVKEYNPTSGERRMQAKFGDVLQFTDEEAEKIRELLGYEVVVERKSESKAHGIITEYEINTLRDASGAKNPWLRDEIRLRGAKPVGAYVYMKRIDDMGDWPNLKEFLKWDSKEKASPKSEYTIGEMFEENGMFWGRTDFFRMELMPEPVMVPEAMA